MNEVTTMAAAKHLTQNGFSFFIKFAQDSVFHETDGSDAFASQMGTPGNRGLIAYVSPTREIARHMETGASAQEALQRWLDDASVCLALARKWGKQLILFQIPSDTTAHKVLEAALTDRLVGAALPNLVRQWEQTKPFFDALAQLEAQKHLGTYTAICDLQAHSVGPADAFESFESCTTTILNAWDQMEKDRQEYDSASHKNLALIGLLSGQISELEEALRETALPVQQLEALTAQLNAVYASTSWRVTSPMRVISRLFRK